MQKNIIPIVITAILSILFFTIVILVKGNYEFLFYLFVVLILIFIVYKAHKKLHFPVFVLWNLLIWTILHLAGGNLSYAGTRLYDLILIPLVGAPYHILRYDQAVHIYGFFAATLAIYYVLKPLLKRNHKSRIALSVVVVMAGLGLGALNEIVEFITTVVVPSTGVGGYINNALDLVTDLLGAIIAFVYLQWRERR